MTPRAAMTRHLAHMAIDSGRAAPSAPAPSARFFPLPVGPPNHFPAAGGVPVTAAAAAAAAEAPAPTVVDNTLHGGNPAGMPPFTAAGDAGPLRQRYGTGAAADAGLVAGGAASTQVLCPCSRNSQPACSNKH